MESDQIDNLRRQLDALVAERNRLFQEIGLSDADGLIAMIRSLESQLNELYKSYGGIDDANSHEAITMLDRLRSLAHDLGPGNPQEDSQ